MCDVQQVPLKLWRRASLEGQDCILSDWGVSGSSWEVLSAFGTIGPHFYHGISSNCQGLQLTSLRKLVFIGGRRSL